MAAADGATIPAGPGNHVEDIDANGFQGRPKKAKEAACLAYHRLISFLLSAEAVAAGTGCEAEGLDLTVCKAEPCLITSSHILPTVQG